MRWMELPRESEIGQKSRRLHSPDLPSDRFRVLDEQIWSGIIRRFIAAEGSQEKAARRLGISQSLLSKLANLRHVDSVSRATLDKLRKHIPPRDQDLLDQALVSPTAAAILRKYDTWVARELSRFGVALPPEHLRWTRGQPSERTKWLDGAVADAKARLANEFEPVAPEGSHVVYMPALSEAEKLFAMDCWRQLEGMYVAHHRQLLPAFSNFERSLVGQGFGDASKLKKVRDTDLSAEAIKNFLSPRGVLAVLRAVEPLMHGGSAFQMELWVQELGERGDLEKFLEVSFARELIVLDREPDLQRAQARAQALDRPGREARRRRQYSRRPKGSQHEPWDF